MGSAAHQCPICGKSKEPFQSECAACTRLGQALIDSRDLSTANVRTDRTPDLIALLAFLNGLFAIVFALLGGTVSPWLGAYLGVVSSGMGLGFGVVGLIRTRPRTGRCGRWLAAAGIGSSLLCLALVVTLNVPLALLCRGLFR